MIDKPKVTSTYFSRFVGPESQREGLNRDKDQTEYCRLGSRPFSFHKMSKTSSFPLNASHRQWYLGEVLLQQRLFPCETKSTSSLVPKIETCWKQNCIVTGFTNEEEGFSRDCRDAEWRRDATECGTRWKSFWRNFVGFSSKQHVDL